VPHILAALDGAESLYLDRVSQIQMDRWTQGRVALVGDAAFCVSLLGGQGSALAMVAAYILAGELKRSKGNHEVAFAEYRRLLGTFPRWKAERPRFVFAPFFRAYFQAWDLLPQPGDEVHGHSVRDPARCGTRVSRIASSFRPIRRLERVVFRHDSEAPRKKN